MIEMKPEPSPTKGASAFLRLVRRVLSFLFIIIFLSASFVGVQPRQAGAKPIICTQCHDGGPEHIAWLGEFGMEMAEWGKKLADWLEMFEYVDMIIGGITWILDIFKEVRDLVADKLDVENAVIFIDDALATMAKATMHKDKKETIIESKNNAVVSKIVSEKKVGDWSAEAYCNNVTARQGPPVMFPFSIFIENTITAANEALFLGPGADGNGPYYAAFGMLLSCPSSDPNDPRRNDPKTGIKEMEFPQTCMDEDEFFRGADITARIVSGEIVELMMPPFVDKTVTLSDGSTRTMKVPEVREPPVDNNMENEKTISDEWEAYRGQQAFMAAWKYCVRAMGSRVTPPSGDNITTHNGMVTTGKWHNCLGVQSTFIKACSKMLAKHTKPNCAYQDGAISFKELCLDSILACEAAAALDNNLPFNCHWPMSLYQAEYASHRACFGREKLKGDANGISNKGGSKWSACQNSHDMWQLQLAKEKRAFSKAQNELTEMSECWPNNNSSPAVQ